LRYSSGGGTGIGVELANPEETSIRNPLIQEAIETAIATKQAAIKAEQKKKRPEKKLIETWEKEIEELERLV
jgi:hypothetical protein